MSGYFHKGRHRKPSTAGRTLARASVVSAAVLGPVALTAPSASADTLDTIEECESGGVLNASNGTHFGLFQFDLATWHSVGGSGNPMNASRSEQRTRAETLLAKRGTAPWTASRHCWGGKAGAKAPAKSTKRAVQSTPKAAKAKASPERASAAPRVAPPAHHARRPVSARQRPAQPVVDGEMIMVRPGDTLSGIAAAHGQSWRALWARNRATVANPNLIFPGERIET